MSMKGYSAFPKAPALLELHHQIDSVVSKTFVGGCLTPLQRRSQCILQSSVLYELNKSLFWTDARCNTQQKSPTCTATYLYFKKIQWTQTRHTRHCWRSSDKTINNVFRLTPWNRTLAWWFECSPMAQETLVQVIPKTQKWYLMPPCLTLNIISYGSRVTWSRRGKRVAPSPTPWCCS